ncbi:hypothetical protein [Streptomyces sp. ITFR-6]|uniref:flagellin N-terminal helical domain-containing protein n=1 Tax=Streptomyces sp. ITFR-6 TaxID=3075197 RepID=UPI00288AA2CE|nr:hypothetical protein [Streptomyces sp. ITFR-6]WNI30435.1 hypothetical protein RLT59_17790 [Streptomyces sp. ITFR-6]
MKIGTAARRTALVAASALSVLAPAQALAAEAPARSTEDFAYFDSRDKQEAVPDHTDTQGYYSGQLSNTSNDAVTLARTTESALKKITGHLQSIRLLTEQAARGIAPDRAATGKEVRQHLEAIDTLSVQTRFAGIKLLAKETSMNHQVGANDGDIIAVAMKVPNVDTLGLSGYDVSRIICSTDPGDPAQASCTKDDGTTYAVAVADITGNPLYLLDPLPRIDAALRKATSLRSTLSDAQNKGAI